MMSRRPPFALKRQCLYWLRYMVDQHGDADALAELWMQASIGPGGLNERRAHWACED